MTLESNAMHSHRDSAQQQAARPTSTRSNRHVKGTVARWLKAFSDYR